jgi:hypothetical protein
MKYNIILMLKATPKWWVMSKEYRDNMFKQFLFPLLSSYADAIQFKVFNAEAFHALVSDFFVVETVNLEKYYQFLRELKTTKLFAGEFFELQDIIMGAENGFKEFNEQMNSRKEVVMN